MDAEIFKMIIRLIRRFSGYLSMLGLEQLTVLFPVFPGRHMESLLKDPVKGPLAAEARVLIDLRDGLGGIAQQLARVVQTEFIQIAVEIGMKDARKDPGQSIGADIEVFGHGGQGDLFREMRGYITYRLVGQLIVDD